MEENKMAENKDEICNDERKNLIETLKKSEIKYYQQKESLKNAFKSYLKICEKAKKKYIKTC